MKLRRFPAPRRLDLLPEIVAQVHRNQLPEVGKTGIRPIQSFAREPLTEVTNRGDLLPIATARHRPLAEVGHDLRPLIPPVALDGGVELVLGAGSSAGRERAHLRPEDADEQVAILDVQDGIDEPLGTFGMKARVGVRLPPGQFEMQARRPRGVPIDFVEDGRERIALRFCVTRGRCHGAEDEYRLRHEATAADRVYRRPRHARSLGREIERIRFSPRRHGSFGKGMSPLLPHLGVMLVV